MIGVEISIITYQGDGNTKEFPYTFTIQETTDIEVTIVRGDTREIITTDYFVDEEEKNVIYPGYAPDEAPAEGEQPAVLKEGEYIILKRRIPISQEAFLGDKWPWNVNEDELDKITMILQDLKASADKCLSIPEEIEGIDTTLPAPSPNAGFYWDETGTKLISGTNPQAATDTAVKAAATAVARSEAAEEYMTTAQAASVAAFTSEVNAKASETAAKASEEAASVSEKSAAASQSAAQRSEEAASISQKSAAASEVSASTAAASAGNIKTEMETELAKLSSIYNYKGTVDTLPASASVGDVYQVKTGDSYVWNGTTWDKIYRGIDFSECATNESVSKTIISASCQDDTLTFVRKDGTTLMTTIDNVAHATSAEQDGDGNVFKETYMPKMDLMTAEELREILDN